MAHLTSTLPNRIQLGAVRRDDWGTQVITRDDGLEVRNNRWATSLRTYEISLPPMVRTDADYIALRALFAEAEGGLHSFDMTDWSDGATVPVRFDTPLHIVGLTPEVDDIDTFTLIEVRNFPDEGPGPPAPPPEWIARGTHIAQNSATVLLPYPAGLLANDVAIAQLNVSDPLTGGGGWNTPAGWTLLSSSNINGDNRDRHYLFWKRLAGSESGTVTFTTFGGMGGSGTDSCTGVMSIFRGVKTTGDPHDNIAISNAGNDTTPNAPSIATFGENRLICNFRSHNFPGASFAAGTDYTAHYVLNTTVGVDNGLMLTTRAVELPQTYSGETASIGSNVSQNENTISVALRS